MKFWLASNRNHPKSIFLASLKFGFGVFKFRLNDVLTLAQAAKLTWLGLPTKLAPPFDSAYTSYTVVLATVYITLATSHEDEDPQGCIGAIRTTQRSCWDDMSAECFSGLRSEGAGQSAGRRVLWIRKWDSKFFGQLQPTQSAAQEFSRILRNSIEIPKDIFVPLFFKEIYTTR